MSPAAKSPLDRALIASVLLLLFWLPLPVGTNLDWAIGLFVLWVAATASVWAVGMLRNPA